jgi:hypothetical protein
MTTPTGFPISLSQMRTEFGLGLPCTFPDAFYGKGGAPASGTMSFSTMFNRSNISFNVPSGSYEHYVTSGTATCTIGFNSNGTVTSSSGVGLSSSWVTPGGTGIGAGYEISFNGGAYQNLGTNRNISVSKSVGTGTTSATYTVSIRVAGGGSVVATGTITINATRDTA